MRCWVDDDSTAHTVDTYWRLKQHVDNQRHTVIVDFAPWLISGRAELTSALLSDLARALGARLGRRYPAGFRKVLKRFRQFAPIARAGIDIAAHGIGAGTIFRAGGDWSQKIADRIISGPSLDEIKKELAQLLSRLNGQQILVVLDDLNRLTHRKTDRHSLGVPIHTVYSSDGNYEIVAPIWSTMLDIDLDYPNCETLRSTGAWPFCGALERDFNLL
jgi:hypothetical protein